MVKLTTSDFILKAKAVHGDLYDYSESLYDGKDKKVKILCREHGYFFQSPANHYKGQGCPLCGRVKCESSNRSNTKEFIEKSNKIHNHKYSYIKTSYESVHKKVIITCPEHGDFKQTPANHLNGQGCILCRNKKAIEDNLYSFDTVLDKFAKAHGSKYDYSFVNYERATKKVKIICPIHGAFMQSPTVHFSGHGCPQCGGDSISAKMSLPLDEFVKNSKIKHNNKYDYSLVEYQSLSSVVKIICPIHGEFIQTARYHLYGSGCRKCNYSKGEREVERELLAMNISFEQQKPLRRSKSSILYFDFYVPSLDLYIEYQGRQHYESVPVFGGMREFKKREVLDNYKRTWCKENNHNLLEIKYTDYKNINKILNKYIRG